MTHVTDRDGSLEMMLDCPVCDFYDRVYYTSKPPTYCSDKCKQKAYRRRLKQKRNRLSATFLDEMRFNGFQGETLSKLIHILDEYGEGAARMAMELAIITAKDVREQFRGGR